AARLRQAFCNIQNIQHLDNKPPNIFGHHDKGKGQANLDLIITDGDHVTLDMEDEYHQRENTSIHHKQMSTKRKTDDSMENWEPAESGLNPPKVKYIYCTTIKVYLSEANTSNETQAPV
ncbi:hypothetical protein BGZ74_002283, partial [Mortierella antarctica]